MAVARTTKRRRVRALVLALPLVVAACSTAPVVEVLAATSTVTPVPTPTAVPSPTPVPTATPRPTPTPLPTPTPTAVPLIPSDILRTSIDQNFEALDELGVQYSFALHVDGFGYLDQRGANIQLLPASNQKIITAMGALELVSPDFRFITELRIDDDGNLYVVGGGDPTVTRAHLEAMSEAVATALQRRANADGVAAVNDVVVDPSHFSATRSGPGWPDRYIPVDVGPMSGFMVDNNQHRGDDAFVADPDLGNAELVVDLLGDAGIEVAGVPLVGEVPAETELVAQRMSPTLLRLVDSMLGRSDNEIAEAIVRQIGLDYLGDSEIVSGKSVIHSRLSDLGLDLSHAGGDGSGLSRENRLSAREVVDALLLAQQQAWWPTFHDGLPDAGTDGTLRERLASDTTIGNVRAKTGTLFDATSLSGVLTTIDGADVLFSFLVNGEAADEAVEHLDQIIIAFASATIAQLTEDQ